MYRAYHESQEFNWLKSRIFVFRYALYSYKNVKQLKLKIQFVVYIFLKGILVKIRNNSIRQDNLWNNNLKILSQNY